MSTKQLTLAICIAGAVAAVYLLLPFTVEPARAETQGRAALIVQFGDGSYVTRCVSFSEASITGLELLTRSGLQVSLWGGAVCRIEQQGCEYPAQACFCQCKGSSCQYWIYWHWRDDVVSPSSGHGSWTYAQIGSGDYRLQDGAVEAWLWGDAQNPPVTLSFAEICGLSVAETPVASAREPSQSASLAQYVVFAVMAIALVAAFWLLRGRRGE
jgi:hypothetical protein